MKKLLALTLALLMVMGIFAGCNSSDKPSTEGPDDQKNATYTYTDGLTVMPSNWNVCTHRGVDDAYPLDYIAVGLYSFIYNDELNPVEGKDPYMGYKIVPEMAADFPVDVTEQVKKDHPEFNIPASATKGFAYTIDLNKDACWENGTPINADTYVESMKILLDPKLDNYRAVDKYSGQFVIAGAEFYANSGHSKPLSLSKVQSYLGAADLQAVVNAYPDAHGYIDWYNSFRVQYDFEKFPWKSGQDVKAEGFSIEPKADDGPVELPLSVKDTCEFYVKTCLLLGQTKEQAEGFVPDEVYVNYTYPADASFDNVGLYKSGDYQITLVLGQSLAGFNLLYSLGSPWLVEPELYKSTIKENDGVYTSNYCTSVETTLSYGPYRVASFQSDKSMRFERNDKWYGYTDGKHVYKDPQDGKTYTMYQTTAIDAQKVPEAATQKLMFLKGQLMTYGLQADDFASYRNSEYAFVSPEATTFFMIVNGNMGAIQKREADAKFDKNTTDLETMTLLNFRKALAITYDKEKFAATISPARSGGYGIIGTPYIYDPDTGARYRDTDQAKKVLCDFYSVDVSKFASLDDAVKSITGYDPIEAKNLYAKAFEEALAAGYITDNDKDGKSDQVVTIEYCLTADNDFMTKTIDYLNEKMSEVTVGTPFEGKVKFVKSAPYGNDADKKLKGGLSDMFLAGWTGSLLNPFGLTRLYTDPAYQYDATWFNSAAVKLTINVPVDGKKTDVTMPLNKWSDALNGATVIVDDKEYNFGEGIVDVETRLDILAAIEGEILKTYNYLPMLQNAGMHLLSQKAFYVVKDYNPVLGRGGIAYLKYNYNDVEWDAYVKEQGGELKY